MRVWASKSRRIVPGPESKRIRQSPICINTAQALRLREGTHVPEPKMVTEVCMLVRRLFSFFFNILDDPFQNLVIILVVDQRFDVRNGNFRFDVEIRSKTPQEFTTPTGGPDWVLVLDSVIEP